MIQKNTEVGRIKKFSVTREPKAIRRSEIIWKWPIETIPVVYSS